MATPPKTHPATFPCQSEDEAKTVGDGGFRPYCVSYPSTKALRAAIVDVRKLARRRGVEVPTLSFTGTVKLHGANVGVGLTRGRDLWVQSRRHVVTLMNDFCGVASHVHTHKHVFTDFLSAHLDTADLGVKAVVMYGEWVGRGIQKGVAMSEVDPVFVVFGIKLVRHREGEDSAANANTWAPKDAVMAVSNHAARIYNVHEFPSYRVTVDFNNPAAAQPQLDAITDEVERCCPVGKFFGVEGVGEGVVWVADPNEFGRSFSFKVKGPKHRVVKPKGSKVKTKTLITVEQLASAKEFAEYAVPPARCEQGWDEVIDKAGVADASMANLGPFLRWIMADVEKEELDTIMTNGLPVKAVKHAVTAVAREWFAAKVEAVEAARVAAYLASSEGAVVAATATNVAAAGGDDASSEGKRSSVE